jgi:hypothetical protein
VGGQNLLPVRRIVFSLLVQDLFSVLEVKETPNCGTTGFAAPEEAVTIGTSAMTLGQGLPLVAIGAVSRHSLRHGIAKLRRRKCAGSRFEAYFVQFTACRNG